MKQVIDFILTNLFCFLSLSPPKPTGTNYTFFGIKNIALTMLQLTVSMDDIDVSDPDPEPNLVRVMSPLLTPSARKTKALSDIFDNKKAKLIAEVAEKEMKIKSAFPEKYQYCGYLSIRRDDDTQWHRKYFVLSNNFLFGGDTQYSTKLSVCIPLEGSNTKLTVSHHADMTFEIKSYIFRAHSPQICKEWISNIERASTLTIYDIYRFRYELGIYLNINKI